MQEPTLTETGRKVRRSAYQRWAYRYATAVLALAVLVGGTVAIAESPASADVPTQEEIDASEEKERQGGYNPDPNHPVNNPGCDDCGGGGYDPDAAVDFAVANAPTVNRWVENLVRMLGGADSSISPEVEDVMRNHPYRLFEDGMWNGNEFGEAFYTREAENGQAWQLTQDRAGGGGGGGPLTVEEMTPTTTELQKVGPSSGQVTCTYASSDPDGDGWGEENGQSCKSLFGAVPDQGAVDMLDRYIDLIVCCEYSPQVSLSTLGEGDVRVLYTKAGSQREYLLGYKVTGDTIDVYLHRYEAGEVVHSQTPYTGTITAPAIPEPTTQAPAPAAPCVDTDGDGWGWDGTDSCKMPAGGGTAATSTDSGVDANGNTYCASASSDPDGDGWGWENNASCVAR